MHQSFKFDVKAEYLQFLIGDESANCEMLEWTRDADERLLAVAASVLAVGTYEPFVPVLLEVSEERPCEDLSQWDQVNECSLVIESGRLIVASLFEVNSAPEHRRVHLSPGVYRVMICYPRKLEIGNDYYKVVLWRAEPSPVLVLKQLDMGIT